MALRPLNHFPLAEGVLYVDGAITGANGVFLGILATFKGCQPYFVRKKGAEGVSFTVLLGKRGFGSIGRGYQT